MTNGFLKAHIPQQLFKSSKLTVAFPKVTAQPNTPLLELAMPYYHCVYQVYSTTFPRRVVFIALVSAKPKPPKSFRVARASHFTI
jgi:hypothetical protein